MNKSFVRALAIVFALIMSFNANAITCQDLDGSYVFSQEPSPIYLGFFGSQFASESIMNPFGTYGSQFATYSVRNGFGTYGSQFGTYSATNPFTSTPPTIWKHQVFIAYLTANSFLSPGVSLAAIDDSCVFYSTVPSTGPAGLPPPPSTVIASDGVYSDKIVVSWSLVSGATAYNVYYSSSLVSTQTFLGQFAGSPINVTGTAPGAIWYFWVYSVNGSGESATGTYDTGYVQSPIPGIPQNVNATDGTYSDKVQVTWSDVSGETSYQVFRCSTSSTGSCGAAIATPAANATSYDDNGANADGTIYHYRVKACNGGGCSDFSAANTGYRAIDDVIFDNGFEGF